MKKWMVALILCWSVGPLRTYSQSPPAPAGGSPVETLQALSAEVRAIIQPENLRNVFGDAYRLKEMGLSYQPQMTAPSRIEPGADPDRLRQFAGMKQFDTLYALAFRKHQEALDSSRALEAAFNALELRSYADWSGSAFGSLRIAAINPEGTDIPRLLDELADGFFKLIPTAMSTRETAHYLMDFLYGFSIEEAYVVNYFNLNDPAGNFREKMRNLRKTPSGPPPEPWARTVCRVFQSFDRASAKIGWKCGSPEKLALYNRLAALMEAEQSGKLSGPKLLAQWNQIHQEITAVREGMLSAKAK